MREAQAGRIPTQLHLAAGTIMALAIFALDVLSPLQGAVAVLYTTVVVMVARSHSRRLIVITGLICACLTIVGYMAMHWSALHEAPVLRLAVSLVAIGITSILSTQQQAAAEQRAGADRRYRMIFNAAGFPIWESDWSAAFTMLEHGDKPDLILARRSVGISHVSDANDAAASFFGYADRTAFIGSNIADHYTAAAEASLARIFAALQRGDAAVEEEVQFRTLAGDVVEAVLRVTLPPLHEGWKHVLVMAVDVTDRNEAQAKFVQSQAELMHVSRVTTLGQLAASIAHEVNQPLSAIVMFAESGKRWLTRPVPDPVEVADCFDRIAANGKRAADVIDHVRQLSRNVGPEPNLIDLTALIHETVNLLSRNLQASGVSIIVETPVELPVALGDRVQIQQVLMNLILNAAQAMAQTAPGQREICVETLREGVQLVVLIRDCGSGLVEINKERLFAPFYTTKADGLGMGLSICRSIIEQHGGSLTACNNANGGATFQFRLPVATTEYRAAA
jgi:two-component system sensor kinase FixL